jgi:competence protein ComEA
MYRTRRFIRSIVFLSLLSAALPALAADGKRVVNINTADAGKLAYLPRVGPAVAERIVDYRKQNGPFKAPEDLMHVRGIGEKTYALIKPYIALSGETTMAEKVRGSRAKADKSEGARH